MSEDKISPRTPEMNYRHERARRLAAMVLSALDEYVPRASRSGAYEELCELFDNEDAEIITDADRRRAGLSPRNARGLSPEEHSLLETRRLQILTAPPAPIIMSTGRERKLEDVLSAVLLAVQFWDGTLEQLRACAQVRRAAETLNEDDAPTAEGDAP